MFPFDSAPPKPIKDFYVHSYISLKNKFFFHTVGKAANSTVKFFFYREELRGSGLKMKSVHDRLSSPLISPYQLDRCILREVFLSDNYYRFTFVRNPYVRLLSCYLDRIQNMKSAPYRDLVRWAGLSEGDRVSFPDFIRIICDQNDHEQNNHWRLQYADTMAAVIPYSFVGKQETFDFDMRALWKVVYPSAGLPDFAAENRSPSRTNSASRIHRFWTDDLVDLVSRRYHQDFEHFAYDKELPS